MKWWLECFIYLFFDLSLFLSTFVLNYVLFYVNFDLPSFRPHFDLSSFSSIFISMYFHFDQHFDLPPFWSTFIFIQLRFYLHFGPFPFWSICILIYPHFDQPSFCFDNRMQLPYLITWTKKRNLEILISSDLNNFFCRERNFFLRISFTVNFKATIKDDGFTKTLWFCLVYFNFKSCQMLSLLAGNIMWCAAWICNGSQSIKNRLFWVKHMKYY